MKYKSSLWSSMPAAYPHSACFSWALRVHHPEADSRRPHHHGRAFAIQPWNTRPIGYQVRLPQLQIALDDEILEELAQVYVSSSPGLQSTQGELGRQNKVQFCYIHT